jgi:hypothetical protein
MHDELSTHVSPIVLWQCACGGADLQHRDYQHVIDCAACERLAIEIGDALEDIAKTVHRQQLDVS